MASDDYPYTRGTRQLEVPGSNLPSLPAAIGEGIGWGINELLAGLFTALTAPRRSRLEQRAAESWDAALDRDEWDVGFAAGFDMGFAHGARLLPPPSAMLPPPGSILLVLPSPEEDEEVQVTIRRRRLPPPWNL